MSEIWLLQQIGSKFNRFGPELGEHFFTGVLSPLVFFDAQEILRCTGAEFDEPLRVDIETSRRLPHGLAIDLLAFFAEQPIDEDLCRVGMSGVSDDGQRAAAAARVGALLDFRK